MQNSIHIDNPSSEKLNHNFGLMYILKFILSITGLILVFSSCQVVTCGPNKKAFLAKYDRFIEKIDALDLEASDKNWEKYDQTFKQYIEECYEMYEDDLSNRERRRFWMKSLKYYSIRYGEGMLNEFSKEEAISEKVRANIEEVLDATGRDLEDFLNKNMEEIEDLVRDIGKDIEDWAAKIKEIFEE